MAGERLKPCLLLVLGQVRSTARWMEGEDLSEKEGQGYEWP